MNSAQQMDLSYRRVREGRSGETGVSAVEMSEKDLQ